MKKHNINTLYVVEIQDEEDLRYLICKYNEFSDTYTEIFTNEKMKIKNKINVEPLSNYYSETKSLMELDKKELLRKYILLNCEAHLQKGEAKSQSDNCILNINAILEDATNNFFPTEGVWYSNCFSQSKELNMAYLPCNLRDSIWLAKMLKRSQKLYHISNSRILEFVENSSFFQEKRHEYEQIIVGWQIDWMRKGGENWIVDEKYGGDFVFHTSVCDLGFRKGVIDTLSKIGMSKDAIEEGIEKNADKWRNTFMERAFINEYDPPYISFNFNALFEKDDEQQERKTLEPVDPEFKEKWLKIRKYEYYRMHKDSVDKYGIVEPDMLMSDEEVAKLKAYLNQKHEERKAQIEQYKQDKKIKKEEQVVLKK